MFVVRAIRATLDGIWLALKPALRFIAWLFALIATVALVNDITLWQHAGGNFASLSFADHWQQFSPATFASARDSVSQTASWLWDPLLLTVLAAPVWILFGLLALFLAWMTRHRERIEVFAN